MWKAVAIASEAIERHMDEASRKKLTREMYAQMVGCHYNEEFAKEDVEKMYYEDESGNKKYAPYWTYEQVRDVYNSVHDRIPEEYNESDFYVALNMMKSDNCRLLHEWFPNASSEEMDQRIIEKTINYLNDPDNPYGNSKIWHYLNPAL